MFYIKHACHAQERKKKLIYRRLVSALNTMLLNREIVFKGHFVIFTWQEKEALLLYGRGTRRIQGWNDGEDETKNIMEI